MTLSDLITTEQSFHSLSFQHHTANKRSEVKGAVYSECPIHSAGVNTRYSCTDRLLLIARKVSVLYDSHNETAITSLTALELVFLKVRRCVLCEVENDTILTTKQQLLP